MVFAPLQHLIGQEVQCVVNNVRSSGMAERSDVLRVQNDALLNEYHHLIAAQIRRIDEALTVLDHERSSLMVEREHLLKYLPAKDEPAAPIKKLNNPMPSEVQMPKFIQKGPRPAAE